MYMQLANIKYMYNKKNTGESDDIINYYAQATLTSYRIVPVNYCAILTSPIHATGT